MQTGRTFLLTDHPEPTLNAEYLVVSTTIDIHNASGSTGSVGARDEHQLQCVTDFVLQPRDRFFRNRPRKKPRCYAETAIVVGPKDHTTWVDEYGRVKISYLWDLDGPRNTTASCWARELHEDLRSLRSSTRRRMHGRASAMQRKQSGRRTMQSGAARQPMTIHRRK
ncbi:hypothetical protein [Paraburkholderia xenovorans]|uniref:hypothetical protein n=1 Tax=Paraburkholderia xenovorans TaxID=36873 RepID=UPI003F52EFD5